MVDQNRSPTKPLRQGNWRRFKAALALTGLVIGILVSGLILYRNFVEIIDSRIHTRVKLYHDKNDAFWRAIVDARIADYYKVNEESWRATTYLQSDREEYGFDSLEKAIDLCISRALPRERELLENLLHTYLYYIRISKTPRAHDGRFHSVLKTFNETDIRFVPSDKLHIAWHDFACGRLVSAREGFAAVVSEASEGRKDELAGYGYFGLFFSGLASGDVDDAAANFQNAKRCWGAGLDDFVYDERNPDIRNGVASYEEFKDTALACVEELKRRGVKVNVLVKE